VLGGPNIRLLLRGQLLVRDFFCHSVFGCHLRALSLLWNKRHIYTKQHTSRRLRRVTVFSFTTCILQLSASYSNRTKSIPQSDCFVLSVRQRPPVPEVGDFDSRDLNSISRRAGMDKQSPLMSNKLMTKSSLLIRLQLLNKYCLLIYWVNSLADISIHSTG
jgi:hypothetical protein